MRMQSTFTFLKHEFAPEQGKALFFYQLDTSDQTYTFTEAITFPKTAKQTIDTSMLDNLLLMLGISYYKLTCATEIQTPTINLTQKQAEFWNNVYTKGLGEFFYKNKLDFRGLIHFPFTTSHPSHGVNNQTIRQSNNRSLLFFGGGKDSIVSAELLKKHNKPFTLFMVNDSLVQKQTAEITNKEVLVFHRHIDPQLFELNKTERFYNGHVPATAIWDFIGLFAGAVYGYTYIVGSNEHSANYGNVEYLGQEINHQWSKSFEFEEMFQEYVKTFITQNITYFSLLRPYHEIKIVEMFSNYPKYFSYFSSCNRNFTLTNSALDEGNRWCGKCSKCLFIFILLSAYLPKPKLLEIFNKNLYDDYSLLHTFRELLGIDAFKPFECVGTPEETKFALLLAYQTGQYANDILMAYFIREVLPSISDEIKLKQVLLVASTEHNISEEFQHVII